MCSGAVESHTIKGAWFLKLKINWKQLIQAPGQNLNVLYKGIVRKIIIFYSYAEKCWLSTWDINSGCLLTVSLVSSSHPLNVLVCIPNIDAVLSYGSWMLINKLPFEASLLWYFKHCNTKSRFSRETLGISNNLVTPGSCIVNIISLTSA